MLVSWRLPPALVPSPGGVVRSSQPRGWRPRVVDRKEMAVGPTWRRPRKRRTRPGSIAVTRQGGGARFGYYELVVSECDGKRALVLRDAQHEYAFVEEATSR